MLYTLKNRIVAFLGWLILKLVDEAGVLKHIHHIQVQLKVSDPKCSVQLALLVTDSHKSSCFLDLTHGRFVRLKVGQQLAVKGGYGFVFDKSGLDHVDSPKLFARRLSQVSRYAFSKRFFEE